MSSSGHDYRTKGTDKYGYDSRENPCLNCGLGSNKDEPKFCSCECLESYCKGWATGRDTLRVEDGKVKRTKVREWLIELE